MNSSPLQLEAFAESKTNDRPTALVTEDAIANALVVDPSLVALACFEYQKNDGGRFSFKVAPFAQKFTHAKYWVITRCDPSNGSFLKSSVVSV